MIAVVLMEKGVRGLDNMRVEWRTDNPPKEKDEYLVTYDCGTMDICWWTNTNMFWPDQESAEWYWLTKPYSKVVAWMPLPKAYHL